MSPKGFYKFRVRYLNSMSFGFELGHGNVHVSTTLWWCGPTIPANVRSNFNGCFGFDGGVEPHAHYGINFGNSLQVKAHFDFFIAIQTFFASSCNCFSTSFSPCLALFECSLLPRAIASPPLSSPCLAIFLFSFFLLHYIDLRLLQCLFLQLCYFLFDVKMFDFV